MDVFSTLWFVCVSGIRQTLSIIMAFLSTTTTGNILKMTMHLQMTTHHSSKSRKVDSTVISNVCALPWLVLISVVPVVPIVETG